MKANRFFSLRVYGHHLYVLLGYLALTLLMTYPLAREFSRAIPGDGFDGWQNVWNLWWVKRALLIERSGPYFTRFVDYPDGVFLYFHTLNLFNGLTFLPFTLNAGNLVAYNVAVVFSFVAGGYGVYLLALYVIKRAAPLWLTSSRHSHLAAFLGGAIFTFSPYHTAHLLGHMQLISLEWLPFYALFAVKQISRSANQRVLFSPQPVIRGRPRFSLRDMDVGSTLLGALFLVLVAMCDWYYAFYMVLFTGLYLLWTIWRRRIWLPPTLATAATGLVFALVTSPVLLPIVRESLTADYMVPSVGSAERLSADLTAFVTPSELHPLWGDLAAGWANRFTASTSERTVFAGYSVLALALVALIARWRMARFWGLAALGFALLALGPVLHIGGFTRFAGIGPLPMPYAILAQIVPLLRISRSVSRFDVVVMLCLGVLAAIGLDWLLHQIHKAGYNTRIGWLIAAGFLAAVSVEFLVAPYPHSRPETRPFHDQLGREAGQFAVMDIPMDWDRPANLLYQTVHQKPTVSGYTSRTNPLAPAGRVPVLTSFRYLGPDIFAGDPQALAPTVLSDLNVRYVIVHKTDLPPGDYRETTLSLVDEIFAGWPVILDDDWLKVLRVPAPSPRLPYLVLGEGWAAPEWRAGSLSRTLREPAATLWVRLPAPRMIGLEFGAQTLGGSANLEIRVRDQVVGLFSIGQPVTTIQTPDLSLPAGETLVRIETDAVPAELLVTRVRLSFHE